MTEKPEGSDQQEDDPRGEGIEGGVPTGDMAPASEEEQQEAAEEKAADEAEEK